MAISILSSKLHIPQRRSDDVLRKRLIEQLDKAVLDAKLILVSAPAGFGKTTILSTWLAERKFAVAWLSLDASDSEFVQFFSYLIAAIQMIQPEIGSIALEALQSSRQANPESLLISLINDIAKVPEPFLIVLDDYHLIDSEGIDKALGYLIEYMPEQMRLMIATRQDPALSLAKLRVQRQIVEIRADELRFSPKETREFFKSQLGFELSGMDIEKLDKRTEGWIAGLQLAAVSLQGRPEPSRFIDDFTGSHRFVVDYLLEEVLQRQAEDIRLFLLQTSILERFSASVCDAVCQANNSRIILEMLERNNMFLIALDESRQWYRYHHLFADALHVHLQHQYQEEIPKLHLRASDWFLAHGFQAEAITHILAAKDFERGAALLESIWMQMDATHQSATWYKWASSLPQEIIRQRPLLSHAYGRCLMIQNNMKAAEVWLKYAEDWLQTPNQDKLRGNQELLEMLPASVSCGRTYLALSLGEIETALHYARQAQDQVTEGDVLNHIQATALSSLAHWANGELSIAEQELTEYIAEASANNAGNEELELIPILAEMRMTSGNLYSAHEAYATALQLLNEQQNNKYNGVEDLHRGVAEIYREWQNLDKALEHLRIAEELAEQHIMMLDWKHRYNVSWARLKLTLGDFTSALAHLDEAQKHYIRSPLPLVRPIPALKALVWIRQGQVQKAQAWADERGLGFDEPVPFIKEFEYLTFSRLLLAQFRAKHSQEMLNSAKHLLEKLGQAAKENHRTGSLIEILILQAVCFELDGNNAGALQYLEDALILAEPQGYKQVFLDEGKTIQTLLETLSEQGIMQQYITRLLSTRHKAQPQARLDQLFVESLSERETEVLRLLATELTGPKIAAHLMISLSTMRTHSRNIYSKLSVNGRLSAIRRAQELGLL